VREFHLFIDADDTLWENNVFFERAFEEFVGILRHSAMSPAEVRASLDGIEHVNNRIHGYGSASFVRNLRECFVRLSERGVSEADLRRIAEIEFQLLNHPMELIEGVEDTLAYLHGRHTLVVCTKGDPAEQSSKIERSGLRRFFHGVEIVKEKNPAQYRALMETRSLDAGRSWMVGNSPKSDINAPLEAGLCAVYVPHPNTWHLEHEPVPEPGGRLLVIERFTELRRHF
jgi:putative hydrolase of the HAD superfamily